MTTTTARDLASLGAKLIIPNEAHDMEIHADPGTGHVFVAIVDHGSVLTAPEARAIASLLMSLADAVEEGT